MTAHDPLTAAFLPDPTRFGAVPDAGLDALCLAPHPDDAEIGAGGTLITMARAGLRVGVLELTRGERGTQGDPDTRAEECLAAARVMGLAWRGQLGLPDGGVSDTPEFVARLADALRRTRPRLLFVPHPDDRHPDHEGAALLARRALHVAALAKADLGGRPHRVERALHYQGNGEMSPDVLIDVEPVLGDWEAAIRAHASQFTGAAISETVTPEIIERRRARLMYWGTFARRRYCEAFTSERPLVLGVEAL